MSDAYTLGNTLTVVDDSAFVARGVVLVGDVPIGRDAAVLFGVIARGDTSQIRLGAGSNLQDGTVVHADPGFPCWIGDHVTVGHRCVVHGARIGSFVLLGMSSTVMNGAEIGEECIIGAGALVSEGKRIPPRSLVLGVPGKVVRPLEESELLLIRGSAMHYVELGRAYKAAGYDALEYRRPR